MGTRKKKVVAPAPVFLWCRLGDAELWLMVFDWARADRVKEMEALDILYSTWTHSTGTPSHWGRLQDKLEELL